MSENEPVRLQPCVVVVGDVQFTDEGWLNAQALAVAQKTVVIIAETSAPIPGLPQPVMIEFPPDPIIFRL